MENEQLSNKLRVSRPVYQIEELNAVSTYEYAPRTSKCNLHVSTSCLTNLLECQIS